MISAVRRKYRRLKRNFEQREILKKESQKVGLSLGSQSLRGFLIRDLTVFYFK